MPVIPEEVVNDLEKALSRIQESGRRYNISALNDLLLTEENFEKAREMAEKEARIVHYNGLLDSNKLFQGILYCLLTPMQRYIDQMRGYDALFNANLSSSEKIAKNKGRLARILKKSKTLFPNQKADYIHELSRKWDELELYERIRDNINISRDSEIQLRNSLIEDIKGLGMKTSSLLLRISGSLYLVPVDSWMTEMLFFHGYDCEMPRFKVDRPRWENPIIITSKLRKTGLKGKAYLQAEEFALDLARKYDVPGFMLQLAFWTKNSSYQTSQSFQSPVKSFIFRMYSPIPSICS